MSDNQSDSLTRLLLRIALARARPCYCYGCICLTPDERAYQRRVFRLARAWGRLQKAQRRVINST